MFALYISLLPEFFLLFGAGIILFVAHFRSSNTPKTYFTLAKFFCWDELAVNSRIL